MQVRLLREYIHEILLEKKGSFSMDELKRLDDLGAMEEYLRTHAKLVGEGGTRLVFDTGLGYVIKLAQESEAWSGGTEANRTEFTASRVVSPDIVPRFLDHDPGFKWLAVERVRPGTRAQRDRAIAKLTDHRVNSLSELLDMIWNRRHTSAWYDLRQASPWIQKLEDVKAKTEMMDFNPDSFAFDSRGNLVLIDLGDAAV